jgi:hypothetical protein
MTVVLTPVYQVDGKVSWTCSADTAKHKYVPSECRH